MEKEKYFLSSRIIPGVLWSRSSAVDPHRKKAVAVLSPPKPPAVPFKDKELSVILEGFCVCAERGRSLKDCFRHTAVKANKAAIRTVPLVFMTGEEIFIPLRSLTGNNNPSLENIQDRSMKLFIFPLLCAFFI
jgi:hypothetical protein